MDSSSAREFFETYRGSVAFIEIEDPNGDRQIGSAFHVGEGVFVTAGHVVAGNRIVQIGTTERVYLPLQGEDAETARTFVNLHGAKIPVHYLWPATFTIDRGPFLARDDGVDVAVFSVTNIDPLTPAFMLGSHLDDWLGASDFVLSDVLLLGYPPVPLSNSPVLVAIKAGVAAQIGRYDAPHVHFVLSTMARAGFSGGVALSEGGFVLGVVTQSLVSDGKSEELGFASITTVEPIYECLADHKMLPDIQAEQWDGLWNSRSFRFGMKSGDVPPIRTHVADVEMFDDGKRLWLQIRCEDLELHAKVLAEVATKSLGLFRTEEVRTGLVRLHLERPYSKESQEILESAFSVTAEVFTQAGLECPDVDGNAGSLPF